MWVRIEKMLLEISITKSYLAIKGGENIIKLKWIYINQHIFSKKKKEIYQ